MGSRTRRRSRPASSGRRRFTVTPHAAQPGTDVHRRASRGAGSTRSARRRSAELETWLDRRAGAADRQAALWLAPTARASAISVRCGCIPISTSGATLPAAGLPWFMALFGRDSLITSFQALPYLPELAATTLRVLAARQATVRDDFQEQEPGKILHELRFGELTASGAATAFAVLRERRRHAAVPGSARRVPPLDRRRRARSRRSRRTRAPHWHGSRTAATSTATATSNTSAAT